MIAFVDTNVLLDVLLKREPFFQPSREVWQLVERQLVTGIVSAISLTNIYYLAESTSDRRTARGCLRRVMQVFRPVAVDEPMLRAALDLAFVSDFEDAVQWQAARRGKAETLVTRNTQDYSGLVDIPVCDPAAFVSQHSYKKLPPK